MKYIFLILLLLGLSGCTLPDYIPPVPVTTSVGTPVSTSEIDQTPSPVDTDSMPGEPVVVTETLPVGENPPGAPQPTVTIVPEVLPTPLVYTRYMLQAGSPTWLVNFAHPEAGCNWMGVGGQVFDINGNAVANLVVKLTGIYNAEPVELLALTGGALNLGPGGYEFKLSDSPIPSDETLWITVFDIDGNAISDPVTFSTYQSCDQNFVMINFSEAYLIENGLEIFLPAIELGSIP